MWQKKENKTPGKYFQLLADTFQPNRILLCYIRAAKQNWGGGHFHKNRTVMKRCQNTVTALLEIFDIF